MGGNRRRETTVLHLTVSGPDLHKDVVYEHDSGPLRIGSGYGNGLMLDEEGVMENHCVVEATSDGVLLSPLGGNLVGADGKIIDDWIKVPFEQVVGIAGTQFEILFHRRGNGLAHILGVSPGDFRGWASLARTGITNVFPVAHKSLANSSIFSKVAFYAAIVMAIAYVVVLAYTPTPSPLVQIEAPKAIVSQRLAEFRHQVHALSMVHSELRGQLYLQGRFATAREAKTAADLAKTQFPKARTTFHSDEAIMQSARIALSSVDSKVVVTDVANGVVALSGHAASRQKVELIEDLLMADVPALSRIESDEVQLLDRKVELKRKMLPDSIVGIWAGQDSYIELEDGVRYWVGSFLEDGAQILSIRLDRLTVSQAGNSQIQEIRIDGPSAFESSLAAPERQEVSTLSPVTHPSDLSPVRQQDATAATSSYSSKTTLAHLIPEDPAPEQDNAVEKAMPTPDLNNVDHELSCLAQNIYFEARNEPVDGRLAVAHVVMNRVTSDRFPSSVCDVVRQGGSSRRFKCQFTWWCDGLSDEIKNPKAWADAEKLAELVYWKQSKDMTGGALFYHANYVKPYWRTAFDKGPQIGQHIFYSDGTLTGSQQGSPQLTQAPNN